MLTAAPLLPKKRRLLTLDCANTQPDPRPDVHERATGWSYDYNDIMMLILVFPWYDEHLSHTTQIAVSLSLQQDLAILVT